MNRITEKDNEESKKLKKQEKIKFDWWKNWKHKKGIKKNIEKEKICQILTHLIFWFFSNMMHSLATSTVCTFCNFIASIHPQEVPVFDYSTTNACHCIHCFKA